MNVFVTGTGRCGSCTFYQACRHLTNYQCGHETQAGIVPHHRYPDNWIEVNPQLVVSIPSLLNQYPDAKWVHLIREREACVRSLQRQCWASMTAFAKQWFQTDIPAFIYESAPLFYDFVNGAIPAMVPADRLMTIRIEAAAERWPGFVHWIGGEGDVAAGAAEFNRKYNTAVNRGRDEYAEA